MSIYLVVRKGDLQVSLYLTKFTLAEITRIHRHLVNGDEAWSVESMEYREADVPYTTNVMYREGSALFITCGATDLNMMFTDAIKEHLIQECARHVVAS
jgi:hypothetical protein